MVKLTDSREIFDAARFSVQRGASPEEGCPTLTFRIGCFGDPGASSEVIVRHTALELKRVLEKWLQENRIYVGARVSLRANKTTFGTVTRIFKELQHAVDGVDALEVELDSPKSSDLGYITRIKVRPGDVESLEEIA